MKLHAALTFLLCFVLAPIPVAASFTILPEQPTTKDAVVISIDEIWRDSCGPINPVVIRERGGVRVHFRDLSGPDASRPPARGSTESSSAVFSRA